MAKLNHKAKKNRLTYALGVPAEYPEAVCKFHNHLALFYKYLGSTSSSYMEYLADIKT
jgi:hypothetical protein